MAVAWLTARPIAHRGYHDRRAGIVENTLSAAAAAIAKSFAIECDLQLSVDGEAIVFHDETLDRLSQATGPVRVRPLAALQAIPLRGTADRIPTLAEFFRQHFEKQFSMKADPFSSEMLEYLQNLNWPGNVRELSNGIARYVLIGPEAALQQEQPQKKTRVFQDRTESPVTLKGLAKDAIKEMEKTVILEALRANQWNRRKTAESLKISYRALIYKIRDAGLLSRRAALRGAPQSAGQGIPQSNQA